MKISKIHNKHVFFFFTKMGVSSSLDLMHFKYVDNNYVNFCYDVDKASRLENILTFQWAMESYFEEIEKTPRILEEHDKLPCDYRFVSMHYDGKAHNDNAINIALVGEIFEGGAVLGDGVDIFLDRSLERPYHCKKCKKVHYLQGLAYAKYAKHIGDDLYDPKRLCNTQLKKPIMNGKSMLAASRVAKRSHHYTDVLFRVAVYRSLNNTYGTSFIKELSGKHKSAGCSKRGFLGNMVECKEKFTFTLDMENSQVEGYVSEKIFTGLLAGNIPVYFGAYDIEKYINPKRIIICKSDPGKIHAVRRSIVMSSKVAAEKSLIKFEKEFAEEINECKKKIEAADVEEMAKQPVYTDMSQMCKTRGLLNWNLGLQLRDIIKNR